MPWGNKFPDMKNDPTYLDGRLSNAETSLAEIVTLVRPSGTDDTTQITNAFANAVDGQIIRFKKGNYVLKNTSTITCNKSVKVEFEKGSTIDGTLATASTVFQFNGSTGTFYQLGADVAQSINSITVNTSLATTLNKGDLILLSTDPANGGSGELWSAARTYYYKGEFALVESISGNTVTLSSPLYDNYVAANTMVAKVNPVTIQLSDLPLQLDPSKGQIGINILYGLNVKVERPIISGASNACLEITNTFNFEVSQAKMKDYFLNGLGLCYGIAVISCQNGALSHNDCRGGRHGITHGGTFPVRNIFIENNQCYSANGDISEGINAHENGEFITAVHNRSNGITLFGRNHTINDNKIIRTNVTNDSAIKFIPTKDGDFFIAQGNSVTSPSGSGNDGVSVQSTVLDGLTVHTVSISDNRLYGDRHGILINASKNNFTIKQLILANNRVSANTSNAVTITQTASMITTIQEILMTGNSLEATSGLATKIINNVKANVFKIGGNIIKIDNITNFLMDLETVDSLSIFDNHFECVNASTGKYIYFIANKDFNCHDNKFVNLNFSGLFGTSPISLISNNILENTANDISKVTGGIVVDHITSNGNKICYGTVTPTTGTWSKGDRTINSNPTVGNPKSWICTTSGSPGTWVSEGNL